MKEDNPTVGLYAGSFDPFHVGHLDVVVKSLAHVDKVLVCVCGNPAKQGHYLFPLREAGAHANYMIREAGYLKDVEVITSTHSLVNIALDFGVDSIIRGFRTEEEEEREIDAFTRELRPLLPTWTSLWTIEARPETAHVSSTMIKNLVAEGMDVSGYVYSGTKAAMEEIILGQYRVAVVGAHESGKTKYAKHFAASQVKSAAYFVADEMIEALSANLSGTRKLHRKIVDKGDRKEMMRLAKPYMDRHRRQFLKKTDAKFIYLVDNKLDIVGPLANWNVIFMPGTHDLESELIDSHSGRWAEARYSDGNALLWKDVLDHRRKHENRWSVPTHEEARGRGFWNDDAGGAHSDGEEGVPEAGGDGTP